MEYDIGYVQMDRRMNEAIDKANVHNATIGKQDACRAVMRSITTRMKTPVTSRDEQEQEITEQEIDEEPDIAERGA